MLPMGTTRDDLTQEGSGKTSPAKTAVVAMSSNLTAQPETAVVQTNSNITAQAMTAVVQTSTKITAEAEATTGAAPSAGAEAPAPAAPGTLGTLGTLEASDTPEPAASVADKQDTSAVVVAAKKATAASSILALLPQLAKPLVSSTAVVSEKAKAEKAKKPVKQEFLVSQAAGQRRSSSSGGLPRQAVKVVVSKAALMTAPAAVHGNGKLQGGSRGQEDPIAAAGQRALVTAPATNLALAVGAERGDGGVQAPTPLPAVPEAVIDTGSKGQTAGPVEAPAAMRHGDSGGLVKPTRGSVSSGGGPRQGVKVSVKKGALMTAPAAAIAVSAAASVVSVPDIATAGPEEATSGAAGQAALPISSTAAAAVTAAADNGEMLRAAATAVKQEEAKSSAGQAALMTTPVFSANTDADVSAAKAGALWSAPAGMRQAGAADGNPIRCQENGGLGKGGAAADESAVVKQSIDMTDQAHVGVVKSEVKSAIASGGQVVSAKPAVSAFAVAAVASAGAAGVICAEAEDAEAAELPRLAGVQPVSVEKGADVGGLSAGLNHLIVSTNVAATITSEQSSQQNKAVPLCLDETAPSSSLSKAAAAAAEGSRCAEEPEVPPSLHPFLEPDAVEPRIVCSIILQRLGNDLPGMQALSLGDWAEVCNQSKDAVLLW
jgi:hypothetical protein